LLNTNIVIYNRNTKKCNSSKIIILVITVNVNFATILQRKIIYIKNNLKMDKKKTSRFTMRILHRYLGFFLVGIMSVYAISGIVLIFRDTNTFKQETLIKEQVKANAKADELAGLLGFRKLKIDKEDENNIYFKQGVYDKETGWAEFTVMELPFVLGKMADIHQARSKQPLFFLNIFFGVALLFFVVSSMWMFLPKSSNFKKGMFFTIGGIVFTLVLLFL